MNGEFPEPASASLEKLGYKLSTAVYLAAPGQENVLYCRYTPANGQQIAAIGAITKSMVMWYQRTDGQLSPYTWPLAGGETGYTICPKVFGIAEGDPSLNYATGFNTETGSWAWQKWVQGGTGAPL